MKKIDKILLLLGMLKTDSVIDIKTIKERLQITERTAYRYINTLTDAEIPVHYDPDLRGYCLFAPIKMNIDSLNMGEIFLIMIGLELLSKRVGEHYKAMINKLKEKISIQRPHLIDELIDKLQESDILDSANEDLSRFVIDRFIQYASLNKESLRLVVQDNGTGTRDAVIKKPNLRFRNGWEIYESMVKSESEISIPLAKILLAQLK